MKKQLNRSEMAGGVIQMRAGGEEEKVGREEQGVTREWKLWRTEF